MGGAYRFAARGVYRMLTEEQSYECYLPRPSSQRLGPQRSFGRAPHVDQSQIGGSLSNVVVKGKVVLRYL